VPVIVPRVPPAEAIKPCDPLPPGGPPFKTENARYAWLLRIVAPSIECRERHEQLREFVLNAPN